MSEIPEDKEFAREIYAAAISLRMNLMPIKGYAQLLKGYLDARQRIDSPVKIESPVEMEMTPEYAAEMIADILNSVRYIEQVQQELYRLTTSYLEG